MNRWTMDDATAEGQMADAHVTCIECRAEGCTGCRSAFCDLPKLVEHCREWMCPGCVAAFDAHIANRCDGTTCHCDAAPVLVSEDEEETTPVEPLTDREMARLDPLGVYGRFAMLAVLALALFGGGACAHGPAPAVQVESVGQLAAGPSVYSAPLKRDAPPAFGGVADTGDDIPETGLSALEMLRVEHAKAGAVDAETKTGGLVLGGAR